VPREENQGALIAHLAMAEHEHCAGPSQSFAPRRRRQTIDLGTRAPAIMSRSGRGKVGGGRERAQEGIWKWYVCTCGVNRSLLWLGDVSQQAEPGETRPFHAGSAALEGKEPRRRETRFMIDQPAVVVPFRSSPDPGVGEGQCRAS